MSDHGKFNSGLWQCESCGAWLDQSEPAGSWRWTGRAWEHGGHSDAPQAGHFPARHFATVGDAVKANTRDALSALSACVVAMRRWGADEDGIPEDAWPAYIAAREIMDATVKDAAR